MLFLQKHIFIRRHTSDKWEKLLFTDECKFNVIGTDNKAELARFNPKCTVKTVNYGSGLITV